MNNNDPSQWKVLLVDDNEDNRWITAVLLRHYDAQVVEAASGEEALTLLDRTMDFSFILLDIKMERVSGFTVLDEIRSDRRAEICSLPVIAISALATPIERDFILTADFDGYISKPYDPHTLIETIAHFLVSSQARQCV